MNTQSTMATGYRQRGFILATVLVFLVVLSLTAFLLARLTRTDIQVVNNLQNEKEAFTIAEAGVHEALYRLSLVNGDVATVTGVNGGAAFNASITPQTGASWNSNILLATAGPTATGTAPNQTFSTPSLQPVSARLPYSNGGSPASETLSIQWDLCTAVNTAAGCSSVGAIRQLPASDLRNVIRITSTGQSGLARRAVTIWAVDTGANTPGGGLQSLIQLGGACGSGISMNGNTTITAQGAIQINAGANSSPPSSCTGASTGGSQSIISAVEINTAGSVNGNFSPPAVTGQKPLGDPLANMQPPCFGLNQTGCHPIGTPTIQNHTNTPALPAGCTGTAAAPVHCSVGSMTLSPGIYYGGLTISGTTTLSSGTYIMAGGGNIVQGFPGGFVATTGNTGVTSTGSGGITIYTTRNDNPAQQSGLGDYGSFSLGNGNATASLTATTTGYYKGITFFQDRSSALTVDLQGGNSGNYTLDGVFYAPAAGVDLQGHTNETIRGSIIANGPINLTGGSNIAIGTPTTPCDPTVCNVPTGLFYRQIAWQDF
jgi:Tfp pilus assembly protein PilX